MTRKNKAFQLLPAKDAVTVFFGSFFSVSASESVPNKEEEPTFAVWRLRKCWLHNLVSAQFATLHEINEEKRAEMKRQLEGWSVETPEADGVCSFGACIDGNAVRDWPTSMK